MINDNVEYELYHKRHFEQDQMVFISNPLGGQFFVVFFFNLKKDSKLALAPWFSQSCIFVYKWVL